MWIMLNDCFFSIVSKDCARDELMVRARRPGDIEKLFPKAKVTEFTASDYHYRAAIKKDELGAALVGEIQRITYRNFKDSVQDHDLHNAYMRVWTAMASVQPNRPYSGNRKPLPFFGDLDFESPPAVKAPTKKAAAGRTSLLARKAKAKAK